jgi:hypothetical protein
MREELNLQVSGHLQVYRILGEDRELILDRKNSIQTTARNILRRGLVGSAIVDRIEAVENSVVLGSSNLSSQFSISNIGEVSFTGYFAASAFVGVVDELRLGSSGLSELFSKVTGLAITKDINTDLQIVWTIRINI